MLRTAFEFARTAMLAGMVSYASSECMAQSPGAFTRTGDLTKPRQFHTATLLTNGKVLIAGGLNFGNGPILVWAGAEIYDPSSGSFTATGDMNSARHTHTATLLPDGKVLLAGGCFQNGGPGQASAELYDPTTGTFRATGSMTTPRCHHTATLLNNGQVLIAGGRGIEAFASALQTAELYDPSTGTFASTGDMTEPGANTATLLPNGKVLVSRSVRFFEENHADLYDPATGRFTRTGDIIDYSPPGQYPLAIPGQQPTAMLLTNGKVLIAGGSWGDFGGSTGAQIYDPSTGAFSATGKMTAGIDAYAAAVLLPEGKVLIAGRYNEVPCGITHIGPPYTGACPGTAQLYDSVTGTFGAPIGSQSMEGHAATLLPDGAVLLSGGWVCCGYTIGTAEIYHPAVLAPPPALFSLSPDGRGQGAILHANTPRVTSPSDPAVAGEYLEMYLTGLADGSVIPPQVAIGGRLAEVLYFGTSGYGGLNQVNVRVPSGVAPGPAVPVRLTYIGRPSNEVTIALQ